MEEVQPEILVVLLYLSLIYEIIIGVRRRGQETLEKMRKVSIRLGKPLPRNSRRKRQTQLMNSSHTVHRHFVRMRILGRD